MRAQSEPRIPKRLPCDVTVSGMRHTGLVLNVSPRGLFVQTNAEARPGSEVSIELTPPHQHDSVALRATVVWKRSVPRHMLTLARGGMGLRINDAPEGYFSFLAGAMRAAGATPTVSPVAPRTATEHAKKTRIAEPAPMPVPRSPMPAPTSKSLRFKVRVSQTAGIRTRSIEVTALSPRQAQRLALREVGEGWQVLDVKLA